MRSSIVLILIIWSTTVPPVIAQFENVSGIWSSDLDRATKLYEEMFYEEAILYFKKVMEVSYLNTESSLIMADCYRRLGMYEESRGYYMVTEQMTGLEEPESMIFYAETLLSTGHLDEARIWFEKYKRLDPENRLVNNRIVGLEKYDSFFADSAYAIIESAAINSVHREFAARPYNEGMAFTSSREKDLIIQHDHKRAVESLIDIYTVSDHGESDTATTMATQRVKLSQHFKSNDGPFTQVNSRIVVSRSNGHSKSEKLNTLGLYFYNANEDAWEYESEFDYNSTAYSITHPAFSSGGDTLYFSSDMPGGHGGTDIYYSTMMQGMWSTPMNLGAIINTPGDEQFPFFDETLYFSSNGHPGLGGFDIYKIMNGDEEKKIENLGFPMNTGFDDFSIYIDGNEGYFASNRPGGLGYDDIYKFKLLPKPPPKPKMTLLDIDVLDSLSGRSLDSVNLLLMSSTDTITYTTDFEGRLVVSIAPETYDLRIARSDYKSLSFTLELVENKPAFETIFLPPNMSFDIVAPDSIIFKFADYRLAPTAEAELDAIIDDMRSYPMLMLSIEAHTDSRGKAGYNLWLSEMRATVTANYFNDAGISMDRISLNGYGESRLLNKCNDGVKCEPLEHAVNRRIEFILYKE